MRSLHKSFQSCVGEGGMVMRCVVTMIKHSEQLFTENFDEYLPIKKTSSEVEVNH